jgi:hypothetical protein
VHIPAKTTTVYDTNPPIEITQKQSLAMSNFWFSGRPVTTPKRQTPVSSEWLVNLEKQSFKDRQLWASIYPCPFAKTNVRRKGTLASKTLLDRKTYPTLGEAYRLKVLFNELWEMPDKPAADVFLRQWCDDLDAAKIPAFIKLAKDKKG